MTRFATLVALLLLGCAGPDVYKLAPGDSQAQLAKDHGVGVYYYYYGHVSRVDAPDGDIENAIVALADAASRGANSPEEGCTVLRDRILFAENGYYSATVKCKRW